MDNQIQKKNSLCLAAMHKRKEEFSKLFISKVLKGAICNIKIQVCFLC